MEIQEINNRCKCYIFNVVMVITGIIFINDELIEDLLIKN